MAAEVAASALGGLLLEELERIPDGDKIKLCIQCGTCSGSCPTSYAMDWSPRRVIAALRAGCLDEVLRTNTVWLCASCYVCTARCPIGIQFTDMMYALKRLGLKHGIDPPDTRGARLMREFVGEVDGSGRNAEASMLTKYFLKADPLGGPANLGLAYRMWRKGRLKLRRQPFRAKAQLAAISRSLEGES
jgi:heterodisulfide reductase subunit C